MALIRSVTKAVVRVADGPCWVEEDGTELETWIILVQEQRWYGMLAFNDKGLLPFFPDCQLLKYCQTKRPVTVPIRTVFLVCHEGHWGR